MSQQINDFKTKIFATALATSLLSIGGSIFAPNPMLKELAKLGIGVGVGSGLVAELSSSLMVAEIEKAKAKLDAAIDAKTLGSKNLTSQIQSVMAELEALTRSKSALEKNFENVTKLLADKNLAIASDRREIETLRQQKNELVKFSASEAHSLVRRTYDISVKKLENYVESLSRNYPAVGDELNNVLIEIDKYRIRQLTAVSEYEKITSFAELMDTGLELQERIIERGIDLRLKAHSIVLKHYTELSADSVPREAYENDLDFLMNIGNEKVKAGQAEVAAQWVAANDEHVKNYETEFAETLSLAHVLNSKIRVLEDELEALKDDLAKSKRPHLLPGDIEQSRIANDIANTYYDRFNLVLDSLHWEDTELGYKLLFSTSRNGQRLITGEVLNNKEERLPDLVKHLTNALNLPNFERSDRGGYWSIEIQKHYPAKKATAEVKLKDILSVGTKRSWFITGHPGSGKTSVMIYLGQQLGGVDAMRVACNPHADDKSSYEPFGFVEVTDLKQIIEQIKAVYDELILRRTDSSRRHPLVLIVDELGAVLDATEKPKDLMDIIKQIGVEGRKLGIITLVGNHSQTVSAVHMDGEFRNAFYQLFLVGAARYAIDQPNRTTSLKPAQEQWIRTTAYPALLLTNGQYSLVKHPTHGDYEEYKDSGNYPDNLEDWDFNDVAIAESKPQLSEDAQKLYSYLQRNEKLTADAKELRMSFRVGTRRFSTEDIKILMKELVNANLAEKIDHEIISLISP